ncbi:MAG: hypothetical protein ACM35H_11660 [Bacteroidota bacterium]|nr:hypothetical protein [Kiloniellaceae bacterium]
MTSLRASLAQKTPPRELPPLLRALWHAAKDQWEEAHRIAQDDDSAEGAWVHAHLHRVEGDEANAGYWYGRAGRPHCKASLDDEWAEIAGALL